MTMSEPSIFLSKEWERVSSTEKDVILASINNEDCMPIGKIASALGLSVKSTVFSDPNVSGEIRRVNEHQEGGEFVIRVNRFENKFRQRFTVAHEIAHFLLHREELENGDGIQDDVLFRSRLTNAIEAEANRLAADLIMPMEKVAQRVNELRAEDFEIGGIAEILSFEFKVSLTAMQIRLRI